MDLPWRAMTISSPRSTASSRAAKWALASEACTVRICFLPVNLTGQYYTGVTEPASRLALSALINRRLERQAHVPGEINPGVLRHFGDERVNHRPSLRLGVDGGEMGFGQH